MNRNLYEVFGKKLDFNEHSNKTITKALTPPSHFGLYLQTIPSVDTNGKPLFGRHCPPLDQWFFLRTTFPDPSNVSARNGLDVSPRQVV
jgi:hypothetical protein